jgi:hypothetical protein
MHEPDWRRAVPGRDNGETLWRPDNGEAPSQPYDGGDGGLAARLARLAAGHPSGAGDGEWTDGEIFGDEPDGDEPDSEEPDSGKPAGPPGHGGRGARGGAAGDGAVARPGPGAATGHGPYRPWFSADGAADPWFAAGPGPSA